jgi:predicted nucleic acid-binding protein
VKFWDSSALVPFLVKEAVTSFLTALYRDDSVILAWWGAELECVSAIARLEREGNLTAEAVTTALERLQALRQSWHEVEPTAGVRETAKRFLRVHNLRAGDALQLAAAFLAAEHRPSTLDFVCLDERLSTAAGREGFRVVRFSNARK